jgi:2-oxoglutarate dehydrogenase E2 component (dihydrolipoamide succinyltransferase)
MPIIEIRMPDDEKEGTEASLRTWFKAVGGEVSEHEPLVEINTDKVTIEIASPATGRIGLLVKQSGDTVLPGDLLGTIETGDAASRAPAAAAAAATEPEDTPLAAAGIEVSPVESRETTFSPGVRKMLFELELDPASIPKTSRGGRLTPSDIGAYLKRGVDLPTPATATSAKASAHEGEVVGKKVPHTPMRKTIARHMMQSVQAAPHVTSFFEADLSNVLADRAGRKEASAEGDVPSVTAYILRAALRAIKLFPEVNSKWHDNFLEQFNYVNFGVGTALENGGLVVPVIHDAHDMDLATLSTRLRTITKKARDGKLTQADMQGGTFTLSNHGVGGSLFAAPIILAHGQAAILGTGKMQKRVIVCETGGRELFRVRPMMYVTLTVDHRVLDGQQTNGFLTEFVKALESSF